MRDDILPAQLVEAVAALLRDRVMPALDDELRFQVRVSVNALALVARAIRLGDAATAAEIGRLSALLGNAAGDCIDADTLNDRLCDRIAQGSFALDDPALLDHLCARSLDRLAIDQPGYSAYRETSESAA